MKNKLLYTLSFVVSVGILGYALYCWYISKNLEITDNAYVCGHILDISPRVSGHIKVVPFKEFEYVEEGQIIFELDQTSYMIEHAKSLANLELTIRQILELEKQIQQLRSVSRIKLTNLERCQRDFCKREELIGIKAISQEEFEHAQSNLDTALADYHQTNAQLSALKVKRGDLEIQYHPQILLAKQQLKQASLNLLYCQVRAPTSGYIAKKELDLGEWVSPQSKGISLVPLDRVWVEANLKETQLSNIRVGQHVELFSDLYNKKVKFKGTVEAISIGTGSVFSLLPPQNATGNWIKVVQRVPVRVKLDAEQLKQYPLLVGLSISATFNTSSQPLEKLIVPQQYHVSDEVSSLKIYPIQSVEQNIENLVDNLIKQASLYSHFVE